MTDDVEPYRSALFGLAYRMLGSVMDAEDIVQEAFIRWQKAPDLEVRSLKAYLTTMVTRMCIDQLRLSHRRREEYVGMWLPEPLLQSSDDDDPAHVVELDESISTAFLVLLENLSPLDRAVFLLHDVFSYTFAEIASIVGKTAADCRQIGHRARKHLHGGRPRFDVQPANVELIVQQFLDACINGDVSELLALLIPDVTVNNDTGGKTTAVRNTIYGADRATRLFIGIFKRWSGHLDCRIVEVNRQAAMVFYSGEQAVCVTAFEIVGGRIHAIYQVFNPDKLKSITAKPGLA